MMTASKYKRLKARKLIKTQASRKTSAPSLISFVEVDDGILGARLGTVSSRGKDILGLYVDVLVEGQTLRFHPERVRTR